MKPLEKDELFNNLRGFLQGRGIDLKDGAYSQAVQTSCHLLSETINLSQQGIERAKDELDKRLDQMRQIIHEKTAPREPDPATSAPPPPQAGSARPQASRPGRSKPRKNRAKSKVKPAGRKHR